jgi:catechol 2,3-dioxygenase-like lactoylglutathione lyase family enzyme
MRLYCAMLFVRDLDRMTAFYKDVVGFRPDESSRTANWVEFEGGGLGLALHAIPSQALSDLSVGSPLDAREDAACKLIFSVPDVDQEAARLEGLGVRILRRPWGGCDFLDPEGNVVGLQSVAT